MNYLDGANVAPKTHSAAKKLIGKHVRYLCESDIDRSGRGYFFPRSGEIVDVYKGNIAINEKDNFLMHISEVKEMNIIEDKITEKDNEK